MVRPAPAPPNVLLVVGTRVDERDIVGGGGGCEAAVCEPEVTRLAGTAVKCWACMTLVTLLLLLLGVERVAPWGRITVCHTAGLLIC